MLTMLEKCNVFLPQKISLIARTVSVPHGWHCIPKGTCHESQPIESYSKDLKANRLAAKKHFLFINFFCSTLLLPALEQLPPFYIVNLGILLHFWGAAPLWPLWPSILWKMSYSGAKGGAPPNFPNMSSLKPKFALIHDQMCLNVSLY